MSEFVHLHCHTEYSLLDGAIRLNDLCARAKDFGMPAAAITDHGNLYGAAYFYTTCKSYGIKPVIGCEVYVTKDHRDKDSEFSRVRHHLILLAKNNEGYHNLVRLVSKGFLDGFHYKPRVDKALLRQHSEGLIALSACLAGEIPRTLMGANKLITNGGTFDDAIRQTQEYMDIYDGRFYLEVQANTLPDQATLNNKLLELAEHTKVPLVATNDCHYLNADDVEAHDVLLCIQTQAKVNDAKRMRFEARDLYYKSAEEMEQAFKHIPEALSNTVRIAEECHVEMDFTHHYFPVYELPEGMTLSTEFQRLAREGLKQRLELHPDRDTIDPKIYWDRLEMELKVICEMGFPGYFLIVQDFINWAKGNDIPVGPGRGSAAGSIVAWALRITNLDPLPYNLIFERFLNIERVSLPDIDVDFCYEGRQEVIDYVTRKYGKDCVAQIVTFGTLAARGVIRDVGRVMDLPYAYVDSISKMIPQELGITIDKALKMNPDLKKLYDTDETVTNLIDMAKRLEGLPRHCSMHAAGVVICQKPVDEYVPLSRAADGTITTQFIMTTLEELGLLKMDFLGLRTLTVIQNAVLLARRKQPELNINQIDYNDQKVLDYIGTGKTDGVFQLESAGMKGFMKELKPHNLEDVIAGISLYRPGPMDFIPQYIRGKNDSSSITYDCPQLEPILAPTYGCIVYQEQVMQIVRDLAGYSLGRSDLLRRAMSKKKAAVMEKERKIFIYGDEETGVPGCIKNGIDEQTANKIYDEMIDFAKYAFNKSHAAAYAVVSYQTAWLKYYFPVEYMAALMTSVIDNPSKVSEYIYACRQMNIKILPPDINKGEANFSVDGGDIRYGLAAIKSIGRPVIKAIVEDREELGLFQNLEDFITRLSAKNILNKRTIENLIKAGALDTLGGTRKQFMSIYVQIVDHVTQEKKNSMVGQMTLFDLVSEDQKEEFQIRMPDVGEYSKETLLAFEKEVLGIYVSGHPLEAYEEKWKKSISATTADFQLDEETGHTKVHDGAKEIIGGMITEKTIKHTKTNQMMAFITVEDLLGTVEVVVFPRDYEKNRDYLEVDSKVFVRGRVSEEDDKPSKMICEKIIPFERTKKELWIQFPDKATFLDEEQIVYGYLADSDGDDEVMIYCAKERAVKKLPKNRNIGINEQILSRLMNHFGEKRVKVVEKPIENIF